MAAKKKADEAKAAPEVTTTDDVASARIPAGAKVVVTRDEPTLDPDLAKIRDAEVQALNEVTIDRSRPEPSIDDELVKARDAEIKAAEDFNKSQKK